MKVIRSLNGDSHLVSDFFYAFSERKGQSQEFSNYYCFKNGIFNNIGGDSFESFVNEIRQESYILNIGSSIVNIGNLRHMEIMSEESTFSLHFDNNSKFNLKAPTEVKHPLNFSVISKMLCDALSKTEKANGETESD